MTSPLQLQDRRGFARGGSPIVEKPPISRGPLTVYRRTDGVLAVCDTRRKIGDWTVAEATTELEAARLLGEYAEREGIPAEVAPPAKLEVDVGSFAPAVAGDAVKGVILEYLAASPSPFAETAELLARENDELIAGLMGVPAEFLLPGSGNRALAEAHREAMRDEWDEEEPLT